ncbi:MAG: xanthan lyase [Paludibacter sp.]|nr:xanthan lyase [Paludibacter sp.]
MNFHLRKFFLFVFLFQFVLIFGQRSLEKQIADSLTLIANSYASVGKVSVDIVANNKQKSLQVNTNEILSQIPFRYNNVKQIYDLLYRMCSEKYSGYSIVCQSGKNPIEFYVPDFYRTEDFDLTRINKRELPEFPLVTNLSKPYQITNGLEKRHIALWQSHGRYYNLKKEKWVWQRARLFQTVEDLYTQSYVLPFLVPMLENAGANVLLPRERDTQIHEVIVDNDGKLSVGRYHDRSDRKSFKTADGGFANLYKTYVQGENPFTLGTYRYVQAVNDSDENSDAEWNPVIPEEGYYGVYVSYKTLPNSAPDTHYTVYYKGGKTEFLVNQQMNGGSWVYLGRFLFPKGRTPQGRVVLTNYSRFDDKIITADAVKFGGGMGNIARGDSLVVPEGMSPDIPDSLKIFPPRDHDQQVPGYITSGYPRFTEGARYWLQWAGMPDSIYSRTQNTNDYSDDFQSRGFWVNYLAGGSSALPGKKGQHVPIDLAFAFHSDAGSVPNDTIIGTLGICTVTNTDGDQIYANGVSRWISRDMVDMVQTQIVSDIRKTFDSTWTRRGTWNKSYSEARVPEVPTMLLELLSHQNFADMRYGLDPRFRFTVSRAIYKGMLRYLSYNSGISYVVEPLPVKQFSSRFVNQNQVELKWTPVFDSIEPTAIPEKYVVYTRIDDGDFDNGVIANSNKITVNIQSGRIYSFKVTAINSGGESFPSEVLSAYRAPGQKQEVLIVNCFDRISAPVSFTTDSTKAGFDNDKDPGVPYLSDISFTGKQYEFTRSKPWLSDDDPGFGGSYGDYEMQEIAGNTFDFPFIHGKAIKSAGYSFTSCSRDAVTNGDISLRNYKIVDFILGEQKQTLSGNLNKPADFKTFPLNLQQCIKNYCLSGGNVFISGSYIASDFYNGNNIEPDEKNFIENILKYKFVNTGKWDNSQVVTENPSCQYFPKMEFGYTNVPNRHIYYVPSVDVIEPEKGARTVFRYEGTKESAGVLFKGKYKTCTLGFPFEAIQNEKDRNKIMESVLTFLMSK